MVSDEELLQTWCEGDTSAGDAFVRRMFTPMRRFFASKVGGEVEELLQQTFARIVEGKHRFVGRSSARAYVYGVARNVLREHYRGRVRVGVDIEESSVRDLGAGPSTLRWKRQADDLLLQSLRTLPLHQQTALELFYWDDLTGREIAEILEIPEGTVASRLRRARERLQAVYETGQLPPETVEQDRDDVVDDSLDAWAARLRELSPPQDPAD